jgi:predicted RNase H-like HicB family nuclease
MEYRVILMESEEGIAVSCPALRGCHSQGRTKEEAVENIKDAIRDWLTVEDEERSRLRITETVVTV